MTIEALNQVGLLCGIMGSILLAFSAKVGVISKSGQIIFSGLDPSDSTANNKNKVLSSHWKNKVLTPIGWGLIALAFMLQFIATFL